MQLRAEFSNRHCRSRRQFRARSRAIKCSLPVQKQKASRIGREAFLLGAYPAGGSYCRVDTPNCPMASTPNIKDP